ncbi:MAG: glycine cleavage system protein GcvH [Pseudonocardiaceae bacterium]
MSNVPKELRYNDNVWVRDDGNGKYTVGYTDYSQAQLGSLVHVELPAVAAAITAGEPCASVEAVPVPGDVYGPMSGEVTAVNDNLAGDPELIRTDPYGAGWMFRMKSTDAGQFNGLMDAAEYAAATSE